MTVQTGLGIEGALVGDLQLVDGIVVDLHSLLGLQLCGGCQTTEGQAHEDAVEPYLIGIDGLVPEYLVDLGAGLAVQLLHHGLDGCQVLRLGIEVVHTGDEMPGADIVEVVVEDVIAPDVALGIDHCVGVFLTVLADVLAAVGEIGVEHALEFDTHHIAPLGFGGEVEEVALRLALHLAVGEPLAIVLVGHLGQGQRTVDKKVVELHVAGLAGREIARLHTIEPAILHKDVVYVSVFLETDDLDAVFRLLAGDILHIDATHRGIVAATADFIVLVVEVDLQHRLLADAHLDIFHIDVLDDATATGIGLDAQYAFQVGGVHHTVVGKDILATATDFRADHHTAMTILHLTVADDDVLRGHVALTTVAVATALDGDTVVAGIEEAVLYQYPVAALRVAAVTIRTIVDHLHPPDGDIGGVEGMDHPEGRTQQGDILHQDAFTLVEVDELRTQAVLRTEHTLR